MELINSILAWFTSIAVNFGDGIMRLSVGGVAFAIFGVRGVLSFKDDEHGPRWLTALLPWLKRSFSMTDKGVAVVKWTVLIFMSILCGVSLFSFGGGILRDALILHCTPWFIEQINQVFAISIVILVYIPIHMYFKITNKWSGLRNIAYFVLVAGDTIGLIEFAQGGQSKAFEVMQGQSSIYILLFWLFLCGFLTQIGGGLCAIAFRMDFSKIQKNTKYYALAFSINSAFYIFRLTSNSPLSSLPAILFLSIIVAFFVDDDTRKKMESYKNILCSHLSSISVEIQFLCMHVKTMDVKLIKLSYLSIYYFLSHAHPYRGNSNHRNHLAHQQHRHSLACNNILYHDNHIPMHH
jgi:uncharacterized membrane protein YeiH